MMHESLPIWGAPPAADCSVLFVLASVAAACSCLAMLGPLGCLTHTCIIYHISYQDGPKIPQHGPKMLQARLKWDPSWSNMAPKCSKMEAQHTTQGTHTCIIDHRSYIIDHISYIIFHISCIIYHISYVIYHVSCIRCCAEKYLLPLTIRS